MGLNFSPNQLPFLNSSRWTSLFREVIDTAHEFYRTSEGLVINRRKVLHFVVSATQGFF